MVDLDELQKTMLTNDSVEFDIHWDVTIDLIRTLRDQQAEIKQLQKDIININSIGRR